MGRWLGGQGQIEILHCLEHPSAAQVGRSKAGQGRAGGQGSRRAAGGWGHTGPDSLCAACSLTAPPPAVPTRAHPARLSHLHLQFLGACTKKEPYILVTELMSGGSLADAFRRPQVFPMRRAVEIALDAARGLAYLHHRWVCSLL